MKHVLCRAMSVILLTSGTLGCSHDKEGTAVQGDDGVSYGSLISPDALERNEDYASIEPSLSSVRVPSPPEGEPAPAVALMLALGSELPEPSPDTIRVYVTPSDKILNDNNCTSGCREKLAPAEGVAVQDARCTVTFIDENTVITAKHCIRDENWSHSYVLINHIYEPFSSDTQSVTLPKDRIARFDCLEACAYKKGEGEDWAIIRVKPLADTIAAHSCMPLGHPTEAGVTVVRSYMLGLRLLEHETTVVKGVKSRLRFTNHGIGSGAPLLEGGKIVGIVKGYSPKLEGECRDDQPQNCEGQIVTWSPQFADWRKLGVKCELEPKPKGDVRLCSSQGK